MTRTSRRESRRAASAFLFVLAVGLILVAVTKVKQHETLAGIQIGVWACLPLALLLGFTVPARCRVRTTRGTACGNSAYGLLFGCSNAAGHYWGKFRTRLGVGKDISEQAPIGRQTAMMYQPTSEPQTIRLTIEDSALTKCGSWATLISTVATVIGVVATFAFH